MSSTTDRICVIGAGCAGLAAAHALHRQGIDFDCVEAQPDIGGNWAYGMYDSVHTISSRKTSAFADFPLPETYPDFPSRLQMLDYIRDFARQAGLLPHIHCNQAVSRLTPLGDQGERGWRVAFGDGTEADYAGVVVANGHLWDKVVPEVSARFSGHQVHSRDYRNIRDLRGERVLVVGLGNSACDIAAEASAAGLRTLLSVRRGHWFVPKTFFGVPRAELGIFKGPDWLQALLVKWLIHVSIGPIERYGLPKPTTSLFEEPPIVSSQLPYLLQHGLVHARPAIADIEDKEVVFADGRREPVDTIVWATGFRIRFPFLDHGLLDWKDGSPLRWAAGTVPTTLKNLYFNGLVSPRGGNPPQHSLGGALIARAIAHQRRHGVHARDHFAVLAQPPVHDMRPAIPAWRKSASAALASLGA